MAPYNRVLESLIAATRLQRFLGPAHFGTILRSNDDAHASFGKNALRSVDRQSFQSHTVIAVTQADFGVSAPPPEIDLQGIATTRQAAAYYSPQAGMVGKPCADH